MIHTGLIIWRLWSTWSEKIWRNVIVKGKSLPQNTTSPFCRWCIAEVCPKKEDMRKVAEIWTASANVFTNFYLSVGNIWLLKDEQFILKSVKNSNIVSLFKYPLSGCFVLSWAGKHSLFQEQGWALGQLNCAWWSITGYNGLLSATYITPTELLSSPHVIIIFISNTSTNSSSSSSSQSSDLSRPSRQAVV